MYTTGSADVKVTLPSDTEIRFTRFFGYPSQLLFEAWTRPEHMRHWWGCDDATILLCEVDLRVGGTWKVNLRMADGSEHPFHGAFREIAPGERLVYSECYDVARVGKPEWLTTVTFAAVDGGTKLTHTIRHRSVQARDGHLQSGMEVGTEQSWHRLDEQAARMMENSRVAERIASRLTEC